MQLDRKVLGFGQLPSTKGDLYAPASGRKAFVHNIILHNTNTTAEQVKLYYHDGVSEHLFYDQSIAAGDSAFIDLPGEGDIVEDGGKYTGSTDTASKVTYKFCGTEELPDPLSADLLWEWNGVDITQFGDGAGTPDYVYSGPKHGVLSVATLSSADQLAAEGQSVLLYTITSGVLYTAAFYYINDLPPLPETYIVRGRVGPRQGSSYGANCIPAVILAGQDATHFFKVDGQNGGNLYIRTGNGSSGYQSGSDTVVVTGVNALDGGVWFEATVKALEPDATKDPGIRLEMHGVENGKVIYPDTSSWSNFGGGVAPSSSWDSGWRTGGSIRRPGISFHEVGGNGFGYVSDLKIYRA